MVAPYFLSGYTIPFSLAAHLGTVLTPSHHSSHIAVPLQTCLQGQLLDLSSYRSGHNPLLHSLIQLRESVTGNAFGLDQELLEGTIFMSTLSCLLLRVTVTDVLITLGAEDKAGKDQLVSPKTRSWGQQGRLPEVAPAPEPPGHCISCAPLPPSPPAQAPLSPPAPRDDSLQGQKQIFSNLFFCRRLSFPLLDLLCNKCSSPLSSFYWSLPEQGTLPGSCTPGELLLSGPCACMLGCWLLVEKQLNKQIQQMEICFRSICRNCEAFVMCFEKKNQHGFGKNRQTKEILHAKLQFE